MRVGTDVRLTLTNRTDSALVIGGLHPGANPASDTVQLAVGAAREVRAKFDSTGTYAYWGAFKGMTALDRNWLDSQLNGANVVDAPNTKTDDYVFLISEWFHPYDDRRQTFEIATVINGKGFPHTQRLTLPQGDSVRFRVVNSTSMNHPMHLHGFYYRIEEREGRRLPANRQPLVNTDLVNALTTEVFSFVPSTPGTWVFHGRFAFHVHQTVSLIGSPHDSGAMQSAATAHAMPTSSGGAAAMAQGGHSMRGLVIAMQVTPKLGSAPPSMANARTVRLHVQNQPNRFVGGVDAIVFVGQRGDTTPAPHTVSIPGPVLERVRGKPVRIVVQNNLAVTARWRAIAKDGADLPRALATTRTANVLMGPGETADFAFTPPTPGRWRLDVASDGAVCQFPPEIFVDPAPKRTVKASATP